MTTPTRDQLCEQYLAQLPYPPYPVQEDALLAWFTGDKGVLVCAPTGTGKTLIAHAALYEALHTGTVAYYTTPLIALTEQKFRELQQMAVQWGFSADDVGLVTGNRRVNPGARILVVVAEILLNRLLHEEAFDFSQVSAVVMDEFHSFADPERGIVWELSLAMLPPHVRLLLLSATVGNAREFLNWLDRCHGRKVELVESTERKVPLTYQWVPDQLLGELVSEMAKGDGQHRKTPALVFCFNRDECWNVAEMFKGLPLVSDEQKSRLHDEVNKLDWKEGVGPKMKQLLHRGVGVHHAGLLPKYRRVVEELFERKLLSFVICTETLAAGINLPARSVVLTSLVKGPAGGMKLIDASIAHQIFGRAGRPQFDDKGYVIALAHEDDVRLLRWQQKYDAIPDNAKDPNLIKAKKQLKKKKPERGEKITYWTEGQFLSLQAAKPARLYSKGPLPWRLLAYLLKLSPEVGRVRNVIRKRLMDEPRVRAGEAALNRMLLTLARGGYVTLEPAPPPELLAKPGTAAAAPPEKPAATVAEAGGLRIPGSAPQEAPAPPTPLPRGERGEKKTTEDGKGAAQPPGYVPEFAHPTPEMDKLLAFRAIHPLYGAFLVSQLGPASREERIQAFESVLEIPRAVLRAVRVPPPDDLPPGPLTARLDEELVRRGLLLARHAADFVPEDAEDDDFYDPDWERPPVLADKLRILFEASFPEVTDVHVQAVWGAGELLRFGGDFNKYVTSRNMVKQEGILFRHVLRLILLCGEFDQVTPPDITPEEWRAELRDIADRLTESCRAVDPQSTDEVIERAHAADVVEGETAAQTTEAPEAAAERVFGEGIL